MCSNGVVVTKDSELDLVTALSGTPGQSLLVILEPESPGVTMFTRVLNVLSGIAGAPRIQARLRASELDLEAFRAKHAVRFETLRTDVPRSADSAGGQVVSLMIENDKIVSRHAGALPPAVIDMVRRFRDGQRKAMVGDAPAQPGVDAEVAQARHLRTRIAAHEASIMSLPAGQRRFFETSEFPWIARFEREWRLIRSELDLLLQAIEHLPDYQSIEKGQSSLTTDQRWKVFFFEAFGLRGDANRARCPQTSSLLDTIPGLTTAMFSILRAGKHLPPHQGIFKGVLRFHLGLRIPGHCRIRVEDQFATWEEGKGMVFDDRFEHEVWNDSDEDRVVLFVDFLRPLPPKLEAENRALVEAIGRSAFVRDATINAFAWEERVGAVVDGLTRGARS
jgi:aspartyl/asparaginyl beta-hydroxylase (cupin superfamily)